MVKSTRPDSQRTTKIKIMINTFLKIKFILFPLTFILLSCQQKLDDYLILRSWIITEMTFKDIDLKPYLRMNNLDFEKNNQCTIPLSALDEDSVFKSDMNAKWSITEGNRLKIHSVKEYMNGEFNICFGKDQSKKSVYIIVKSQELYIKAYRGNFGEGFKEPLPISCYESM